MNLTFNPLPQPIAPGSGRHKKGRGKVRGVALIIVMVVIIVLGVIAGGFAYSMKVETTLARNVSFDAEMEWLGRSAVEFARYVLALQSSVGNEPFDALNQKWAGGPGSYASTNEVLSQLSLENNELGRGKFSIKIVDQERKININSANKFLLLQVLTVMGVSGADASIIIDSIIDWRDPDNDPQISGTESDDYLRLEPPYVAKNGPIDDISELLRIRGVTMELYWGPSNTNSLSTFNRWRERMGPQSDPNIPTYPFGLVDVFTAMSSRQVNVNTASSQVLQLVPGLDPQTAGLIIQMRSGPDGAEGTLDDMPFRDARQIPTSSPDPQVAAQMSGLFTVRSSIFQVDIDCEVGATKKHFVALLRRNSPRDIQALYFYSK